MAISETKALRRYALYRVPSGYPTTAQRFRTASFEYNYVKSPCLQVCSHVLANFTDHRVLVVRSRMRLSVARDVGSDLRAHVEIVAADLGDLVSEPRVVVRETRGGHQQKEVVSLNLRNI